MDDDRIAIQSESIEAPNSFELSQNYPNPFNTSTIINYQLAVDSYVLIKIYNARGREIKTLIDEFKTAASYTVQWNGRDNDDNQVTSGICLYRTHAGNYVNGKKTVVWK